MPGLLTRALFQLLTVNPKHRVSSLQDMRAAPALPGGSCGIEYTSIAWKIPWMEEPGRLQTVGSLRVGHD